MAEQLSAGPADAIPTHTRGRVIRVLYVGAGRGRVEFADGLSRDQVNELDDQFGTFWTDQNRLDEVREFMERHATGGLAIVLDSAAEPSFPIPAALSFPFEPAPLDEPNVAILLPLDGTNEPDHSPRSHPNVSSTFGRWFLRYGIGVGGPINLIVGFCFNVYRVGWNWWDFGSRLALLVIFVLIGWWWGLARNGVWHLVPGGVVILRSWRMAARRRYRIVSPANAILYMTRVDKSWRVQAIAHDGRRIGATRLTDRECMAFLAAWRSPLAPPTLEQLEQAL